MAFADTVIENHADLPAGEVIKSAPYNVSAYEVFEDGLLEGRLVKLDSGSVDNLDGSASPTLIGVAKRKVTGEIGDGVYSTSGQEIDQVAEVIDFGYATVTVTDAADPSKLDPVHVINADTDDAGKATEDSAATGAVSVTDVVFWEEKASGVWLVRIPQYMTGA